MAKAALIIPAAGMGERLGVGVPKALYTVGGQALLSHALRAGVESGVVTAVVVAGPVGLVGRVRELVRAEVPFSVQADVVEGGATRQASVRSALSALPDNTDVVLVHDAARCLTPASVFADVTNAVLAGHDAVVPGLAVVDTLKQVDASGAVVATPERSTLRAVQTPQAFRLEVLDHAHRAATVRGDDGVSDDAGLVEQMGVQVHVVPGHEEAFKITHPLDVLLAEAILNLRGSSGGRSDDRSTRSSGGERQQPERPA